MILYRRFCISRLTEAVPRGTGLRAKTSNRCLRVDGSQSKLSEVGATMGVLALVSQMWTVLMATLESMSRLH